MNQRCYFHKTQSILHFCSLKQCTLPLCQQCLEIHQQQHEDKRTSPAIIPYHQAYQQVSRTLNSFVQNVQSVKQNYLKKLNHDKAQCIKAVEEYYEHYYSSIQQQSAPLLQIQQRLHKLQKGSIKTVIYFYSGDISLKQPQYPEFKQISHLMEKYIQNLKNPQVQDIQTFRNQVNILPQIRPQQRNEIQYETKQRTNSKKKLIFSNEKYQQSHHKNTNFPYLQNPKKQNCSFKTSERENSKIEVQSSEVKNYFNNENFSKQSSLNRKEPEVNLPVFMQNQQNNRVLRQTPIFSNVDYRGNRSKTLDKFPSMAELKIPKQNLYQPLVRIQQTKKTETIKTDSKPGKWNKQKINYENNQMNNNPRNNSIYSEFTVTEPLTQKQSNQIFLQEEFPNRQPLKTADLDTYTPSHNPAPVFQSRQRAFSYEPGLRTTMSHNNLQLGKKIEPILGDELKKNVLSPQEIRKMLQKKIEERNKILVQKKQHQLKINTDRTITNNNATLSAKRDSLAYDGQRNELNLRDKQMTVEFNKKDFDFGHMQKKEIQFEQRSGLYNTRESIINQIYRETRY